MKARWKRVRLLLSLVALLALAPMPAVFAGGQGIFW